MATSTINNGVGEDYGDISTWEAATDNDLVSATTTEIGECYTTDGDISDSFTAAGANTNSSYYRTLTAASGHRHGGLEGTGVVVAQTVNWGPLAKINEAYFVIEHLRLRNTGTSGSVYCLEVNQATAVARYILSHDCVYGFHCDAGADWYRCICKDMLNDGVQAFAGNFYNCTVYNCSNGFYRKDYATVVCKNCISVGNSGSDWANGASGSWGASDYNISDDGTEPGANSSQTTQNLTTEFFESAADCHLRSGSDAVGAGTNLGSPYDTDIDGDSVTGDWDVGADQYEIVAASGDSFPGWVTKSKHYLRR